ncbi:DUF3995 domain-containing protein [Flavobacterium sp. N2038]|uniref:DUF3995 domain-containing protein n=1 Tax=Flavobacterium sp. N2038 TaxID=2986829 RepID=UPI002225AC83|nr:DUF3995 domain-containing protein [Flavobacterium sp. N2038]
MNIIALLLFLIFAIISGIHFYWGFGGKWGSKAVVPTKKDETPLFVPDTISTFVVAVGTLFFGVLYLIKFEFIPLSLPIWLDKYGFWSIIAIFTVRAIGEFNYVGFFKKHKNSQFAVNDTKYYSPLCLVIGILTLVLELNK